MEIAIIKAELGYLCLVFAATSSAERTKARRAGAAEILHLEAYARSQLMAFIRRAKKRFAGVARHHKGVGASFRHAGSGIAVLVTAMEVCGWTGGLVLICAYAMVSFGKISPKGAEFQCLNLPGGLMLAANSAWHHAWPSASVNLIWIGVGLAALMRESLLRQPD